jgi:hypothetical protein
VSPRILAPAAPCCPFLRRPCLHLRRRCRRRRHPRIGGAFSSRGWGGRARSGPARCRRRARPAGQGRAAACTGPAAVEMFSAGGQREEILSRRLRGAWFSTRPLKRAAYYRKTNPVTQRVVPCLSRLGLYSWCILTPACETRNFQGPNRSAACKCRCPRSSLMFVAQLCCGHGPLGLPSM